MKSNYILLKISSKITQKHIFLACPKDRLYDDYYEALQEHFGLADGI